MRRPVGIVAATWICAGACGAPAPRPRPVVANVAPARHESLAEVLRREVGSGVSVAIVGGSAGLRAISSDGARQRVLARGAVAWALVDPRSDVVWFGSDDATAIRAIDLDAPDADPPPVVTVVTGLPGDGHVAMVGAVIHGVVYPSQEPGISPGEAAAEGETYATGPALDMASAHVDLSVEPSPSMSGSSGYVADADWEAAVARAPMPGRAFVLGLLARTPHQVATPAPPAATRVAGVDPSQCETPDDCGKAEPIAGTRYWRVMTANFAGDVRHITWRLYDAGARRFLPQEWASWIGSARVAPDHTAFLGDGVLVRFDTGPLAVTPRAGAASGGGWLDGGDAYWP